MIKLTAKQIQHFGEISRDKEAVNETLKSAMYYHSNRMNELKRDNQELWAEVIKIHDLDPTCDWTTKKEDGAVIVVEVDRNEA